MLKLARKTLSLAIKTSKRVVLGNADLPEQCTVAMNDPQSEVAVWLHGLGAPIDVTERHAVVCAAPPIVAMRLDGAPPIKPGVTLLLRFRDRGEHGVILGQLELQNSGVIETGGGDLCLFEVRSSQNYCLPRLRIWGHSLFHAWLRARSKTITDVAMTAHAADAMTVLFICPRPVVLVSLTCGDSGNIFPMNLMGSLGDDYFGFGLNSRRLASSLVKRAGRIAISSIPFEEAAVARQLGKNHRREGVDWNELPFRVTPSPALGIPVPSFALRVREMEIEAVRGLGSHTLFAARIIRAERLSDGPQFFMIHGIYQAWRRSQGRVPPEEILPE